MGQLSCIAVVTVWPHGTEKESKHGNCFLRFEFRKILLTDVENGRIRRNIGSRGTVRQQLLGFTVESSLLTTVCSVSCDLTLNHSPCHPLLCSPVSHVFLPQGVCTCSVPLPGTLHLSPVSHGWLTCHFLQKPSLSLTVLLTRPACIREEQTVL